MKLLRLSLLCAALGVLVFTTNTASAQIRIGSQIAFNFDGSDVGIGANAHVGFSAGGKQLLANPSVDFFLFNDNVSITRINLDVAYPIDAGESFTPYVGAGLLVQRISIEAPAIVVPGVDYNDTDFGLNFFFGAFFMAVDSPIRPFARVSANVGAGTGVSAQAGASFRITQ